MADQISLRLPDNSVIEVASGLTLYEIIGTIGKGLQRAALAARVNGILLDLTCVQTEDADLEVVTFDTDEGKHLFWHSSAHLMAQAVKRLFPEAKFAIGPSIEHGFYYDIDLERGFSQEDLQSIETEMKKIVEEKIPVVREDISRKDAIKLFSEMDELYKVEMLQDMAEDTVSIYKQGDFLDLCRGPHLPDTGYVKSFKLLSIAGAYWRGDEKNKMLQRIYGISFPDSKSLDKHVAFLEEVKKRDHRKLGKELDLFSTHDEVGGGLIFWHPRGARLRTLLEEWWRKEHFQNGYEILYSPHIGRSNLWETSGHLGFYSENMYAPMQIDGNDYFIKPMNCPFHIMIYKDNLRSYRDLPLRWAELGTVYRYEKSGVLHGLLRVRGFTQDDAHIFCTPEQVEDEILEVLRFSLRIWKTLGFSDIKAYLATKPEKSVGDPERWSQAQDSLKKAIEKEKLEIVIDEGGGAFYGPKIDLKVRDAIGREWQMTTIQFDFNLPERFDMTYMGVDGQKHRPYMIHRALLGSLERFFGILIEHYGGRFPVWLSPVQAVLISVSEEQAEMVGSLCGTMKKQGYRIESDIRNESIGYKIREAISSKVPYLAVVGKREMENGTLSVRRRGEKDSEVLSVDEFMKLIDKDIADYR